MYQVFRDGAGRQKIRLPIILQSLWHIIYYLSPYFMVDERMLRRKNPLNDSRQFLVAISYTKKAFSSRYYETRVVFVCRVNISHWFTLYFFWRKTGALVSITETTTLSNFWLRRSRSFFSTTKLRENFSLIQLFLSHIFIN